MKKGSWRDCSRYLFITAVARDMGIVSEDEFLSYANEIPQGKLYSRRELISHGSSHDMVRDPVLQQLWINVCSHLSICELISLDPEAKDLYEQGIALSVVTASVFNREFEKYTPDEFPPYDHDWRKIVPSLKKTDTYDEIIDQIPVPNTLYKAICPVRVNERKTLGQTLFGAWIVASGKDRAAAEAAHACLCECVDRIDWSRVGQCYAFAAECADIAYRRRWSNK